jgi:hypothetical protein
VTAGERQHEARGALAAIPLAIDPPAALTVTLEVAFAGALIALTASSFGRHRDVGIQVGLPILVTPLLLHTAGALGGRFLWPENTFDGPGYVVAQASVMALCLVAYCFAPRPFARAVARPLPVLAAIAVSAIGAWLARASYAGVVDAVKLAIDIQLTPGQADPRLAMYMLAVATLVWTLVACATAPAAARRSVGAGLALLALGSFAFRWPHHWLLPLLGVALIAEAARHVRDDELAATFASTTPPISDAAWSGYITQVTAGLRRAMADVHSLTTRGEGGLASSLIVGDAAGVSVRARIDRIDGCVLALDVVLGRELDELSAATLTVWAIAPRALGKGPASPPAQFDERFKLRGSEPAFAQLFDDGLRARAVASLDGWVAYWEGVGLRYRVYPGRGAPLDHPLPLSDLALGRAPATAERVVSVIELLLEVAGRAGVAAAPALAPAEPAELA